MYFHSVRLVMQRAAVDAQPAALRVKSRKQR